MTNLLLRAPTRIPAPFPHRFRLACETALDRTAEPGQHLSICCRTLGTVPAPLEQPLLQIARECVVNAVRHGMHLRLLGRIRVTLCATPHAVRLDIADDGWGCGPAPRFGAGLRGAHALATALGGSFALERRADETLARVALPGRRP
jgi:signal transduction histidine kinase